MRWRALLLLLLALLLPVRGALAATMLCTTPASGMHVAALAGTPPDGADHPCHVMEPGHPAADLPGTAAEPDRPALTDEHGSVMSGCHACAAGCCLTVLSGALPAIGAVAGTTGASFPALLVPAAHFLSSGQDRPPRGG